VTGKITETLLTEAVINDDRETIRKHHQDRRLVLAKNSLGFDCIEIAKHLNRQCCLDLLEPHPLKKIKVKKKSSSNFQTIDAIEFERIFRVLYHPYLVFANYRLLQRVIRSCPNAFRKEKDFENRTPDTLLKTYQGQPELFTLRGIIYRDKFRQGFCMPMRIEWVNNSVGYGLFADRPIQMGDFVGSYCGEVRRLAFWLTKNDYSIVYPNLAWIQTYLVDAKTQGNEMRFLNHSYNPNLSPQCAVDRGLIHSLFVAARDIQKGEQLTWNYGEDFWEGKPPPQEL